MKKFINDTEGKVINYIVDDNPDKIYFIGTLVGMKCFIDTTENNYSYQAYARYKKANETRYYIEAGAHTFEVDEFYGDNQGLVLAEVEFESLEQANAYIPPEWFGRDVSITGEYQNSKLSRMSEIPDFIQERTLL